MSWVMARSRESEGQGSSETWRLAGNVGLSVLRSYRRASIWETAVPKLS